MEHSGYALRFVSGKYQGNEFPLKTHQEVIIGRGAEFDITLVEDMISRKHARITFEDGQVVLEDLGSTNGSFVNGERVRRAVVQEGDRILLGTSVLQVIPYQPKPSDLSSSSIKVLPPIPSSTLGSLPPRPTGVQHQSVTNGQLSVIGPSPQAKTMTVQPLPDPQRNVLPLPPSLSPPPTASSSQTGLSAVSPLSTTGAELSTFSSPTGASLIPLPAPPYAAAATASVPSFRAQDPPPLPTPSGTVIMSGGLEDMPLADLLELFTNSGRNGILVVKSKRMGHLIFQDGCIVDAVVQSAAQIPARKAAKRILHWQYGSYELYPPQEHPIEDPIQENGLLLLQQLQRQKEERKRFQSLIPLKTTNLKPVIPLKAPLR
ncbi:MAG: FHA domain-containing protein, partial [Myxococcota bacterium]